MVKGIIETVESKYEYRVRIPVYHRIENTPGAIPTEELPIAPVCTAPGVSPFYKKGDIVWIEFENDEIGHPVITGLLYREDMGDSTSDIKADSIDVNVDANLPTATQIGVVGEQSLQSLSNITQTISNIINIGFVYRGTLDENDDLDNIELLDGWYNIEQTVPLHGPDGNWNWSKLFMLTQNGLGHQYLIKPTTKTDTSLLGKVIAVRERVGVPAVWRSWRIFSTDDYKGLEVNRGILLAHTSTSEGYQHLISIKNTAYYYVNSPIIFRVMDRSSSSYDITLSFTSLGNLNLELTKQNFYCKGINPQDCVAVCSGDTCNIYVKKAEAWSDISITNVWNNAYISMNGLQITYPNTYYGTNAPTNGIHAILVNDISINNGLLVQNDSATWIGAQNTATNNTIQIGVNATGIGGLYDRTHEKYIIQVPSGGSPVYYQSGVVSGTNKISGNEYIRTPLTKGQAPSANVYSSISFTDGTLGTATSNRLGLVECQAWPDGSTSMAIGPYRNVASSTTWSKFYFHTTSAGSATAFFPGNVIASHGLNTSALVRAQNTSSNGAVDLLVDTAGNKGIYDRTNTKWMFHKTSDNTLWSDQTLNVNGMVNVPSGQSVVLQGHYSVNKGTIPVNASGTKVNQVRDIRILTADNLHGARFTGEITSGGHSRAYIMAYAHNASSTISGRSTQFFVQQPSDGGAGSAYLFSNGDNASRLMAHEGNIHRMFPVGSVLCMSTNSAPALGGTWTLIDKEFKTQYADKVSSIALNTTNTTSVAHVYTKWSGHTIQIAIDSLVNKVALADSTVTLFTMTPANFGVSSFGQYDLNFTSFSDAGQALITFNVATNGAVQYLDSFVLKSTPTQGLPAGTTTGRHVFTIIMSSYSHMADDYCDKFYFKRTA